ncbi:MAG TPA: fumarylacetoacetate hydrolase family protein [Burkholderiaceae bacterium]|nr:fumarylacetoacetate hydrolase family protein [Burkholderiaceae bacterium]
MTPDELLHHYDQASLWPQASGLDVPTAYARALAVRAQRVARGERPMGYKVGFTNRNIWPRYQVFGPIWGSVYDTTTSFCDGQGEVSLAGTSQPRLEPECVFGMARTPPAEASLDELLASVAWVAPGFEIVQSHLADWKFAAADTVADGALHARLLVGPRVVAAEVAGNAQEFEERLARARIVLCRNGTQVDAGVGANVLDGPLHALQHFLQELRACPGAPDLQPGDVVTTGTWTDAWPVLPGEQWVAEFEAPLLRLEVRFR